MVLGAVTGVALLSGVLVVGCLPTSAADVGTADTSTADAQDLRRDGDAVSIPSGSPYRRRIVVRPVELHRFEPTIALPAQVEADPARVYNVLPPLGGRVVDLKVELGDHVKKDQPLVTIDSGDLAQAYTDVGKAAAQAALTHRALERARSLVKAGGGAVKDFESAINDAAQADSELARAQSRLNTIAGDSKIGGPRTFIVSSPATGVITALGIASGAYINDPTQTMMTVTNIDHVWVTAFAPESDLAFIAKGQPVDVNFVAYPNRQFRATVVFINDVMEPDTRRTKIRLVLANPDGRLKPNMFATVTIHGAAKSALLVPNGALLMNNDSTSVFIETAPWTFVRRAVQTGSDVDGRTVVTTGLSEGDRIVASGGVLLND